MHSLLYSLRRSKAHFLGESLLRSSRRLIFFPTTRFWYLPLSHSLAIDRAIRGRDTLTKTMIHILARSHFDCAFKSKERMKIVESPMITIFSSVVQKTYTHRDTHNIVPFSLLTVFPSLSHHCLPSFFNHLHLMHIYIYAPTAVDYYYAEHIYT